MSKLFFDHLIDLRELDKQIKKVSKDPAEREELWTLVDETIHHRVMGCILDKLPRQNHIEFLDMFDKHPHDEEYLFNYLRGKIGENVEELIRQEIGTLGTELLNDIKHS